MRAGGGVSPSEYRLDVSHITAPALAPSKPAAAASAATSDAHKMADALLDIEVKWTDCYCACHDDDKPYCVWCTEGHPQLAPWPLVPQAEQDAHAACQAGGGAGDATAAAAAAAAQEWNEDEIIDITGENEDEVIDITGENEDEVVDITGENEDEVVDITGENEDQDTDEVGDMTGGEGNDEEIVHMTGDGGVEATGDAGTWSGASTPKVRATRSSTSSGGCADTGVGSGRAVSCTICCCRGVCPPPPRHRTRAHAHTCTGIRLPTAVSCSPLQLNVLCPGNQGPADVCNTGVACLGCVDEGSADVVGREPPGDMFKLSVQIHETWPGTVHLFNLKKGAFQQARAPRGRPDAHVHTHAHTHAHTRAHHDHGMPGASL